MEGDVPSGEVHDWIGMSEKSFTLTASDLGRSIKNGRKWLSEVHITYEEDGTFLEPQRQDALNNSERSGDSNIVHRNPDAVEDMLDNYGFLNDPSQDLEEGDRVVVNQGMSTVDAVTPALEEDLREVETEFENIIYAAENGAGDKVHISGGPEDMDVEVASGSEDDSSALDAGRLEFEFDDDIGRHHNEHLNAVMDLAVGRGYSTPENERNGELLMYNRLKVDEGIEEIEWERIESLEFDRQEDEEILAYDVHISYSDTEHDTDIEAAMRYEEKATYLQDFHNIDALEDAKSDELPAEGWTMFTPVGAAANAAHFMNQATKAISGEKYDKAD